MTKTRGGFRDFLTSIRLAIVLLAAIALGALLEHRELVTIFLLLFLLGLLFLLVCLVFLGLRV